MTVDERLAELGIALPHPGNPVASYVMAQRSRSLLFLSGHIAKRDGVPVVGTVGGDVTREEAQQLARQVAIDLLSTVRAAVSSLDSVRVVKVTGFVRSAPGFTEQPFVINGASDLFVDVLGERGQHARSAVGVAELPLGAALEIEAVFEDVAET